MAKRNVRECVPDLDVIFNKDQSSVRNDHAPENMATVRRMALSLLNTANGHFKGLGFKRSFSFKHYLLLMLFA